MKSCKMCERKVEKLVKSHLFPTGLVRLNYDPNGCIMTGKKIFQRSLDPPHAYIFCQTCEEKFNIDGKFIKLIQNISTSEICNLEKTPALDRKIDIDWDFVDLALISIVYRWHFGSLSGSLLRKGANHYYKIESTFLLKNMKTAIETGFIDRNVFNPVSWGFINSNDDAYMENGKIYSSVGCSPKKGRIGKAIVYDFYLPFALTFRLTLNYTMIDEELKNDIEYVRKERCLFRIPGPNTRKAITMQSFNAIGKERLNSFFKNMVKY